MKSADRFRLAFSTTNHSSQRDAFTLSSKNVIFILLEIKQEGIQPHTESIQAEKVQLKKSGHFEALLFFSLNDSFTEILLII